RTARDDEDDEQSSHAPTIPQFPALYAGDPGAHGQPPVPPELQSGNRPLSASPSIAILWLGSPRNRLSQASAVMFSTMTSTSSHAGVVTAVTNSSPAQGTRKTNGVLKQVSDDVAQGVTTTWVFACGQSPFASAPYDSVAESCACSPGCDGLTELNEIRPIDVEKTRSDCLNLLSRISPRVKLMPDALHGSDPHISGTRRATYPAVPRLCAIAHGCHTPSSAPHTATTSTVRIENPPLRATVARNRKERLPPETQKNFGPVLLKLLKSARIRYGTVRNSQARKFSAGGSEAKLLPRAPAKWSRREDTLACKIQ